MAGGGGGAGANGRLLRGGYAAGLLSTGCAALHPWQHDYVAPLGLAVRLCWCAGSWDAKWAIIPGLASGWPRDELAQTQKFEAGAIGLAGAGKSKSGVWQSRFICEGFSHSILSPSFVLLCGRHQVEDRGSTQMSPDFQMGH